MDIKPFKPLLIPFSLIVVFFILLVLITSVLPVFAQEQVKSAELSKDNNLIFDYKINNKKPMKKQYLVNHDGITYKTVGFTPSSVIDGCIILDNTIILCGTYSIIPQF